jgi:hypothetical protein
MNHKKKKVLKEKMSFDNLSHMEEQRLIQVVLQAEARAKDRNTLLSKSVQKKETQEPPFYLDERDASSFYEDQWSSPTPSWHTPSPNSTQYEPHSTNHYDESNGTDDAGSDAESNVNRNDYEDEDDEPRDPSDWEWAHCYRESPYYLQPMWHS